jgi:hypothetical protein
MGKVLAFRVGANLAAVVTLGERHVDMGLLAEAVGTYFWVCVRVHTYMRIRYKIGVCVVGMCVCVCVCVNVCVCMYVCMYVFVLQYPLSQASWMRRITLYIYIYIYIYIHTHTHTYIHTHIHTYIHNTGVGRNKIHPAKPVECVSSFGYLHTGIPPCAYRTSIRVYIDTAAAHACQKSAHDLDMNMSVEASHTSQQKEMFGDSDNMHGKHDSQTLLFRAGRHDTGTCVCICMM